MTNTTSPAHGTASQRWRNGRLTWRPADAINTREYEVSVCYEDSTPKAFVEQHHYSGSYPAARFRTLLHCGGELVGVAVFSHPPSEAVLEKLPCERLEGVELGRFVLLPSVKGNGESWFLARSFELLRAAGFRVVLSHSDPVPRRTHTGELVLPGHVGLIYQATNAVYAGRTNQTLHVLKPDGTIFSPRSMTKIRRAERGYMRAVDELVEIGATPPTARDLETRDARRAWMWESIMRTCRRLDHGGNHRYVWAIDKKLRRDVAAMATGDKYPKKTDELA